MGYGGWDASVYSSTTSKSAFTYSTSTISSGRLKVHPTLDPKGLKVRESRDSDDHPNSRAIAVWLDVTGSNISQAHIVHKEIPNLQSLLLRKGYVADPQIMFSAVGDATCDGIPLQVGQFESDNRMDENLGNVVLEGGGGGQRTESYELAAYVMARHTDMDCFNKRGQKGYLFIIGDEMPYPRVSAREVNDLIGDGLEADIPTEQIFAELRRKYEVFYILPKHSYYGGDPKILGHLRNILGENVLEIEDTSQICAMIAGKIGQLEGFDNDEIMDDLKDAGFDTRALATVGSVLSRSHSGGSMATVTGKLPTTGLSRTTRL